MKVGLLYNNTDKNNNCHKKRHRINNIVECCNRKNNNRLNTLRPTLIYNLIGERQFILKIEINNTFGFLLNLENDTLNIIRRIINIFKKNCKRFSIRRKIIICCIKYK